MKKNWLKPHWEANSCIHNIDIKNLVNLNLKVLLLDVDGTLLPREAIELNDKVKDWVIEAKKLFKVHLLSNNPSRKRIKLIADKLELSFTYRASKPFKRSAIKVMNELNYKNHEIAIVGDRLFTDVLIGRRLGFHTILVKPITKDG